MRKLKQLPGKRVNLRLPIALTIAGSDSGGGAGIQADLKTFASLGVHGTSVITCVTAQNPVAVSGIQACAPEMLWRQLEAVYGELQPSAAKTGMLYSTSLIRTVTDFLKSSPRMPLVVDPVMISTSGARLLNPAAIELLRKRLLPLATLVTPNLQEAELLTELRLRTVEDLRTAAKALYERHGCPALVKGGHLRGLKEAIDIFYDGHNELLLTAPFLKGVRTHGTGCTYSAAVTAFLSHGVPLSQAVQHAKEYITQAIAGHQLIGGYSVLNSFWRRK
jgi:hydroxymethylpyrimidine/phosphomethylpyrimidine kinase